MSGSVGGSTGNPYADVFEALVAQGTPTVGSGSAPSAWTRPVKPTWCSNSDPTSTPVVQDSIATRMATLGLQPVDTTVDCMNGQTQADLAAVMANPAIVPMTAGIGPMAAGDNPSGYDGAAQPGNQFAGSDYGGLMTLDGLVCNSAKTIHSSTGALLVEIGNLVQGGWIGAGVLNIGYCNPDATVNVAALRDVAYNSTLGTYAIYDLDGRVVGAMGFSNYAGATSPWGASNLGLAVGTTVLTNGIADLGTNPAAPRVAWNNDGLVRVGIAAPRTTLINGVYPRATFYVHDNGLRLPLEWLAFGFDGIYQPQGSAWSRMMPLPHSGGAPLGLTTVIYPPPGYTISVDGLYNPAGVRICPDAATGPEPVGVGAVANGGNVGLKYPGWASLPTAPVYGYWMQRKTGRNDWIVAIGLSKDKSTVLFLTAAGNVFGTTRYRPAPGYPCRVDWWCHVADVGAADFIFFLGPLAAAPIGYYPDLGQRAFPGDGSVRNPYDSGR